MTREKIILAAILLFAFLLRLVKLSEIPPGLNRDEAAIGYTAYSILKTGRDEYGAFLPISLKSFGDWKLPVYMYAVVPSVQVFKLTEFAIRLPSVIAGTLTVLFTYLIARHFFRNESMALTGAALIAVSPWHTFFSRVASESNLAVFWVSLSLYLFSKAQKYRLFLILGVISLGLSLLTYHGNHIFTPLFFVGMIVYFRTEFRSKVGFISISVFVLAAVFIYSQTLFSADKTKISGLLAINDPSLIHEHIDKNRLIFTNPFLAYVVNNKFVFFFEQLTHNYLKSFSPEFLFIKGGTNRQHNIPDFGNLYVIEAPFLLLGLYFLFKNKEKAAWFFTFWLLISPIGATLTKDAPHSARQFAVFPALSLVIGYGLVATLSQIKKGQIRQFASLVIGVLFTAQFGLFVARYFVLFPYKSYAFWGSAYKEMVAKVGLYQNSYKEVIVSRPDYSPYVYYLFYTAADPRRVQQETERYQPTAEGFEHVKAFAGIRYQKIDWTDELLIPNRLYVDWVESIPSGATHSATLITKTEYAQLRRNQQDTSEISVGTYVTSRIVDSVNLPDASPLLYFIETRGGTPSSTRL